jgi:hypothetical protein
MDLQAIDVHGRIAFANANCAQPKTGQKRRWRKVRFRHIPSFRRSESGRNRGIANADQAALIKLDLSARAPVLMMTRDRLARLRRCGMPDVADVRDLAGCESRFARRAK